ncbi:DUF1761 domain-containing protein [Thermaurantiacus sp.]
MVYILLNLAPILLATLAGLVAGVLWWRLLAPPRGRLPTLLLTAALAQLWLAAILAGALILAPPQAPRRVMVLLTPVVIWAGFVVPAILATHAARGIPWRTALADCGHWLVVMLVQAVVLEGWGLVPPPR